MVRRSIILLWFPGCPDLLTMYTTPSLSWGASTCVYKHYVLPGAFSPTCTWFDLRMYIEDIINTCGYYSHTPSFHGNLHACTCVVSLCASHSYPFWLPGSYSSVLICVIQISWCLHMMTLLDRDHLVLAYAWVSLERCVRLFRCLSWTGVVGFITHCTLPIWSFLTSYLTCFFTLWW
jgi:hypothetical protein